ncbi:hypothetical protein HPP92_010737 [Vanilla planifolia]|uniref:anthranilate synthase n=1 Tax=Vanilla planifolia TaxID=51239 RepID=A0A835R2Z3_VANPL|nr:hypothetical protein HPP92_010737 [Vanilla planifolia]
MAMIIPKSQLVQKIQFGPLPHFDARWKKHAVAFRRVREGTSRKDNFLFTRCKAVQMVDGSRVLNAVKDQNPIIVIDNYDSFTYNLCQYIGELGANFEVYRNDDVSVDEIRRKKPRGILISPGPGAPKDSGISLQTVLELGPSIPIFGVCMGLQCIGEAFGGNIVRSPYGVVHGKSAFVYYDEKLNNSLFFGLPNPFEAARYHSLVIKNDTFPGDVLEITAWTEDGLVMAARHKKFKHIQGVQFHPESVITTDGKRIVQNFLMLTKEFLVEPNQD